MEYYIFGKSFLLNADTLDRAPLKLGTKKQNSSVVSSIMVKEAEFLVMVKEAESLVVVMVMSRWIVIAMLGKITEAGTNDSFPSRVAAVWRLTTVITETTTHNNKAILLSICWGHGRPSASLSNFRIVQGGYFIDIS